MLFIATVSAFCATPLKFINTEFLIFDQNSWNRLTSAVDAHEVVIAALKARNGVASKLVVFNASAGLLS